VISAKRRRHEAAGLAFHTGPLVLVVKRRLPRLPSGSSAPSYASASAWPTAVQALAMPTWTLAKMTPKPGLSAISLLRCLGQVHLVDLGDARAPRLPAVDLPDRPFALDAAAKATHRRSGPAVPFAPVFAGGAGTAGARRWAVTARSA
jgi:hypothetical protein